ncbi:MAG TPA: glutamate racemase [Clostridiales bacterium]|nr:glutamate racemase [Clostridiales bacterium]
MDNRPLGVFDSGLGGLTCIEPLLQALPNERILYFGDTARTPYGSKSPETIQAFSLQIADHLVAQGAKVLVIACNTISSTAIPVLRERYRDIPIIGIIQPAASEIARCCSANHSIGIIGTKVTIQSRAYEEAITEKNPDLKIHAKACPAFVPLIEEGIIENEIMDLTVHHYLDDFIRYHEIDTLALGCTHYPLILENLIKAYPQLQIIDPSRTLAEAVKETLEQRDMLAEEPGGPNVFGASDLSENFVNLIHRIIKNRDFKITLRKF